MVGSISQYIKGVLQDTHKMNCGSTKYRSCDKCSNNERLSCRYLQSKTNEGGHSSVSIPAIQSPLSLSGTKIHCQQQVQAPISNKSVRQDDDILMDQLDGVYPASVSIQILSLLQNRDQSFLLCRRSIGHMLPIHLTSTITDTILDVGRKTYAYCQGVT